MTFSWSVNDKHNPPPLKTKINIIMVYFLWAIDIIWNHTYELIKRILWPLIFTKNIPYDNEQFSGDFNALANKGILRFILDKTYEAEPNKTHITFRLVNVNMFMPLDIKLTREILQSPDVRRGKLYDGLVKFFGYGIFTSRIPERWKQQKYISIKLLHGKYLKNMSMGMYNKFVSDINKYYIKANDKPIDLVLLLSRIGLFAFCDSVLGVDVRDIGDELAPAINRVLNYINSAIEPFVIPFDESYNNIMKDIKFIHNWMLTVVDRIDRNNVLDNPFVEEILKIEDKKQQVELMISMVLGGHETTGRLMLGTFYELMRHPQYQDQIRNETELYISEFGEPLNYESVMMSDRFHRLHTIIKESLRLFPPVWLLSRSPTKDITLLNHNVLIKKDTQILISPLILQRQEAVWGKNANEFYPERFDNAIPDFFPFVIGNEKCPADKFAVMEPMLVIAAFFKYFNVRLMNPMQIPNPISGGTFRLFRELFVYLEKI